MCLLIGEMHFNSSLVPIPVPCIREASTMRSTVLFRSMGIEIQIMNHIWPSFFFSFSRTLCCKSQGIKTVDAIALASSSKRTLALSGDGTGGARDSRERGPPADS